VLDCSIRPQAVACSRWRSIVWHTPHPGYGDAPGCSTAQSAAVTPAFDPKLDGKS
jgi:hypothetical protein